jgi:hypothetical protein
VQNAPGMPPKAALSREAGIGRAKLARLARNVKNFHRLIFHGIVKNSEVRGYNLREFSRDC